MHRRKNSVNKASICLDQYIYCCIVVAMKSSLAEETCTISRAVLFGEDLEAKDNHTDETESGSIPNPMHDQNQTTTLHNPHHTECSKEPNPT
jgi:hypothetical protein